MTRDPRPDEPTAEDAFAQMIETILALPAHVGQPEFRLGCRAPTAGGGWYWEVNYYTAIRSGRPLGSGFDRHKAFADAARSYREGCDRDRSDEVTDG